MKILLLYPPLTDPTSGYHSLVYLASFARSRGFKDIEIVDTNIEALHYSMLPKQVNTLKKFIKSRRKELERKNFLDGFMQIELTELWKSDALDFEGLLDAVRIMKDPELFYKYEYYRPAAELLSNWINVLSILGYPGLMKGFSIPTRSYFNLMNIDDLTNEKILNKILAPFSPYIYDRLLPKLSDHHIKVIGINVTYVAQLPFALAIAKIIRNFYPEKKILFGGTEVTSVWKYLSSKDKFFHLFNSSDACLIGEGENAFVSILEFVKKGESFKPIPNVLIHPKYGITKNTYTFIRYEDLSQLSTPDFSLLPWDKYLSPHPLVYYSPSRGCYWNKCTFCDYGLNFDSPTSPWRQQSLDKIMCDLKEISKKYKYIYMSVDVLAPSMLLNMAKAIVQSNLDIRWGAEIRLEKYWSSERCSLLKKSGCIAISVGYESGNQRILNLINKGTTISKIQDTIINFNNAGIGVQIMGFTGFPTETFSEAIDSVKFLKKNRNYWTFGGLGNFILTQGAIIAKKPSDFALVDVRPFIGEDIAWQMYYVDTTKGHGNNKQQDEILNKEKALLNGGHLNRPWLGGVDTAHTLFYHDYFGVDVLKKIKPTENLIQNSYWYLNGKIVEDLDFYSVQELLNDSFIHQIHANYNEQGKSLSSCQIEMILKSNIIKRSSNDYNHSDKSKMKKRYFISRYGRVYPFPDEMLDLLLKFSNGAKMSEILESTDENNKEMYEKLIRFSIEHSFLRAYHSLDGGVPNESISPA